MNWLRTFELVAWHKSFTRAAEDLFISTSAVSQQIKQLEEFLDVQLFTRHGNRLCLTEAGEACVPTMHDAFRRISKAVDQMREADHAGPLNVSVAPSFATKWLMPRLDRFYAACPEIDLAIFVSMNLASLEGDDIDIAIRYGSGLYPGFEVRELKREHVVPVASPSVVAKYGGLSHPSDLASVPLIHDNSQESDRSCPDWRSFLTTFGIENIDWQKGPRFNQSALVIDSVINGWGAALAKETLAGDALREGHLQRLFDYRAPVSFGYYAVCMPEKTNSDKVSAFIDWLAAEAAVSTAALTDPTRKKKPQRPRGGSPRRKTPTARLSQAKAIH